MFNYEKYEENHFAENFVIFSSFCIGLTLIDYKAMAVSVILIQMKT